MTFSTSNHGNHIMNKKLESKKLNSFNIPNFFVSHNIVKKDSKTTKNKTKK